MPDPVVPRIIAVSNRFRRELLGQERGAATRMVRAYGGIWARLLPRLDAITADIEARQVSGEAVSADWLRRQARYRELLNQVAMEIARFAGYADLEIQGQQNDAIKAALAHAQELVGQALPPGLTYPVLAEVGIVWNRLPDEAVANLVGVLGNGSPLRTLLDAIPGNVTAGVSDALLNGVAQGWGPRKTARVIRQETGMGLSRALRISRTEIMRAYRTASRQQWEMNPQIVKGWRRHAAHDERTCLACLALDGKRYARQEDMDDHVQGRCGMVPETIGYEDLGLPVQSPPIDWEKGEAWFGRQSEAMQERMMGAAKYRAWKDGKFEFRQLAKRHDDPDWGPSWTEASLKDLGIDWRQELEAA